MNDSADIYNRDDEDDEPTLADELKTAEARLKSALDSLDKRLSPVMEENAQLQQRLLDAEAFSQDRAQLAQRLDEVTAEAAEARQALEAKTTEMDAEAQARFQEMQSALDAKDAETAEREQLFTGIVDEFDTQLLALHTQVARALGEG